MFQVPFHAHHRGSDMDQSHKEGATAALQPQATEEIWHGPSDPQEVLQLHHRKRLDQLYHRLVWQLHRPQPQGSTEGCADGPTGHLHQAVYEEGLDDRQGLQSPKPRIVHSVIIWQGVSEHWRLFTPTHTHTPTHNTAVLLYTIYLTA